MNSIRPVHAGKAVSEEGTAPCGSVAFVYPIEAIHELKLQDDEPVGLTLECCAVKGRDT
jgi:hypothetical protein